MTVEKSAIDFLQLMTELLSTYPTAIRQNAVRMGLVAENDLTTLTSQTLSKAIQEWSIRTNATNTQVESVFKEIMSVDSAIASVSRRASGKEGTPPQYDMSENMKYAVLSVLFLGTLTLLVGAAFLASPIRVQKTAHAPCSYLARESSRGLFYALNIRAENHALLNEFSDNCHVPLL